MFANQSNFCRLTCYSLLFAFLFFVETPPHRSVDAFGIFEMTNNATGNASAATNLQGVAFTPMFAGYNLSDPLIPIAANRFLFRPFYDFNNQLANVANQTLPRLFAMGGERLGSAIAAPLLAATNASNSVIESLNRTIDDPQAVLVDAPAAWFDSVALAMRNATAVAVNSTANNIGDRITSVGGGISGFGSTVQMIGDRFVGWLMAGANDRANSPLMDPVSSALLNQASIVSGSAPTVAAPLGSMAINQMVLANSSLTRGLSRR